jgi:hypothetical protein
VKPLSDPFKSADGHTTYVTMNRQGTRRRVEIVDGEIEFLRRKSKAEKKADKRARARRRL